MKDKYVGKGIGRLEGLDKASGRAMYAGDYSAEDMLHVAVVRAPVAHGFVEHIDISGLPEGVLFFGAEDLVENIIEDVACDSPVFASEHIRYDREPVALVAAESEAAARTAARMVKVVCQPLPVIETVHDALKADAPEIHPGGNLIVDFNNDKGCARDAFADCDVVVEDSFVLPVQDHGYMEPEAAFAFTEDGILHVYTSTQNIYNDRRMVCRALGLSETQVHVKAATVGGGFGGKDGHTTQIFAALVAHKTGRPARLVFDRTESLAASYKRHGAQLHVKIGARSDGTLVAFDGRGYLDTGAYIGLGTAVLGLFCEHLAGPYVIPNVHIECKLVYTNKMPAHAMRGFGAPQGAFATEMLLDRIARQIHMDPIALRVKNALRTGSIGALGQKMEHCVGFAEALKLVEASDLWQERSINTDPYVGYGIAGGHLSCGLGKNIPDDARVEIRENEDGTYEVRVGLVDIGQGSTTALAALAADALTVPLENIRMIMADTDKGFDCGSTAGSRSTFIAGNAILNAADLLKKMPAGPGRSAVGLASFPESGKSFSTAGFPHAMYTFIAQAVKLRVDPVTGGVELLDIFAATEAGRVVNPLSMAGQMQGGVAMSVGYALMENCMFCEGRLVNSDFSTYLMPTAMDVPRIQSAHVEAYEGSGPAGVKGAAEVATVSIAPAIGNAITSISGVDFTALPFDRYKLLIALKAKEENK